MALKSGIGNQGYCESYHELFRFVRTGLIEIDTAGIIRSSNPVQSEMLGCPADGLLSKSIYELSGSPAEAERLRECFKQASSQAPHHFHCVTTLRVRDGQGIPVHMDWVGMTSESGPLRGFVGAITPIHKARDAESPGAAPMDIELMDLAMEAARMGFWTWLIQTGEMFWHGTQLMHASAPIAHTFAEFLVLVHAEDRQAVAQARERAVATGCDLNIEFRNVWPDGTIHWIAARGRVRRNVHGEPVSMVGTGMDITDRKHAEERLRLNEQFTRSVLDSLPANMAVLDKNGNVTMVNTAWDTYANRNGMAASFQAMRYGNYLDVCRHASIDSPEAQDALSGIRAVLDGSATQFRMEYPCHSPTEKHWFAMCAVPLPPQIGGAVVSHVDITQRKLAEEAYRQSEERFHELADNIEAVFWVGDIGQEKVLYVSPGYERIWGRSRAGLLANWNDWLEGIHPEDRNQADSIKALVFSGQRCDVEYRVIRPDGSVAWVRDLVFQIYDNDGQVCRVAGIATDVTERRQFSEQLRQHAENLEQLVQARAAQVLELERQRGQSEKLAATGRMAAQIAHEINNPLAGIKNSLLLIKDAVPQDHPDYPFVGRIEREIDRISRIVRQMFELYRPEQGQPRVFVLHECVRDVVLLLAPACREKNLRIDVQGLSRRLAVRLADASLRQILFNLIKNAIDASPQHGTITIAMAIADRNVTVSITDQGPGIPDELRHRVFEPFFTTKAGLACSGIGLGLSVSRSLVEAMGGILDFQSPPTGGTSFRIRFPDEILVQG